MKDTATIWMEGMHERAKRIDQLEILIGFVGPYGLVTYSDSNGMNVATVAMFNEFGTNRIPKRSFLRPVFIQRESEVFDILADAVEAVLINEKDGLDEFRKAAKKISRMVYEKADSALGWAKPLAASTVARKGSMKPLDDSGLMIENIGWAIQENGSIVAYGKAK